MTPLNLDQLQKFADEAKRAFTGKPKALWSDRTYLAPKDAEALSALIEQNRALVEAVKAEKERASTLLEAAYEALDWLGPGDSVAEEMLAPAILRADPDHEYAAEFLAERGYAPRPQKDANHGG